MPAPKGNKNAKGNNGGRPTKYKDEFAEQARKLCLLGATDAELADFFEVDESTINNWKIEHIEFLESIKKGKGIADANVADRLYQRALGYEHEEVKLFQYQGDVIREEVIKHYPPDTTSAIFWLKNRQKDKWRDMKQSELTGKDGGPIQTEALDADKLSLDDKKDLLGILKKMSE